MFRLKDVNRISHIVALIALLLVILVLETYRITHGINFMQDASIIKTKLQSYKIKPELLYHQDFRLIFGINNEENIKNTPKKLPITEIPIAKRDLILKGILAVANEEINADASVIISHKGQEKVYFIGDTIPGGGYIYSINADHVIIKTYNKFEKLYLIDKDSSAVIKQYKFH